MAHRVYVDSTDDFVMWRAVDAIGAIANPRVLVVDDYPAGADALQLLLEQNGFEARAVNDASLACAVAEEWLPFAVVVDVVMPGVTGLELARRLRAGVLTRDMLLVAFTREPRRMTGLGHLRPALTFIAQSHSLPVDY
ncbi:Response regulator receiver domain protein [Caballeronia sp. SBC1]|nr:Response regulator receiver domain protein [Caballeronia sp. SBC1]